MQTFSTPNRIVLFSEKGYLKGLMVAQDIGHYSKVYEHVSSLSDDALKFCNRTAAENFARALNDHPGGTIWNVVEIRPQVGIGS